MAGHVPLIIGGFVAFVLVCAVIGIAFDSKRREENQAFAQERGWHYQHEASGLQSSCANLPFGRKGSRRSTRRTFTGEHRGLPFEAFEHRYWVSGGGDESDSQYDHQVTRITLPQRHPLLVVEPSGIGHTLARALGVARSAVDDPEFDKAFKISAESAVAVEVFGPETRRRMLADPRFRARPVRLDEATLTTWQKGTFAKDDVPHALEFLHDALELLAPQRPRTP